MFSFGTLPDSVPSTTGSSFMMDWALVNLSEFASHIVHLNKGLVANHSPKLHKQT